MIHSTINFRRRSRLSAALVTSASGLAMVLAASAAPAQAPAAPAPAPVAQTPPADDSPASQDIVVTGSRITSAGFDAPVTTQVLGTELLAQQAQPNIFNAIAQIPSLQGSTGSQVANGNTSTGMTGLAGLNLRGLGTFRTLTLLDGQRVVASNINNITDISQFPQLLIQRVEVSTGGASASYGSDGIAGVVNFVTNKRFEGFKAVAQGGITTYGDDPNGGASVAWGGKFLDGRLHVSVSAEYFYNRGIIPGDSYYGLPTNGRPNLPQTGSFSYNLTTTPAGQPQTTYYLDNVQNITQAPNGLVINGPLQGLLFGIGGVPQRFNYGGSGVPNRTAAGGVVGCLGTSICVGGDFEGPNGSAGGDDSIDGRLERKVAYGRISYEVSNRFEIYGTVNLANVDTVSQPSQGIPRTLPTVQCDNAYLNATIKSYCANPGLFNGLANQAPITSFTVGSIGQNLPQYLRVHNARKQRRFVVGAEGGFDVFGKEWKFDAYYEHGKSRTDINVTNNVLFGSLYAMAIDAVTVSAANVGTSGLPIGSVACRSTLTNPTNGCLPYNPFGAGVQNNMAAFRYFAPASGSKSFGSQRQDAASFVLNGTPFSLWAGDVSVALGAEYRKEQFKVRGDPYGAGSANSPYNDEYPARVGVPTSGQAWFAGNFTNGGGSYDVKDAFIEFGIPLLKDSAVGSLTFNPAARVTDYSTSGRVVTWKLAGAWDTPLDGLRLRITRSRDIRAPNLADLYSPAVAVNSQFSNPFGGNPAPQVTGVQQRTIGNPTLRPEIGQNLEAGVVYSPRFIPGLRLSFDYFDIKLRDAISVPGGQTIINLCFEGNQTFCGLDNYKLTGAPGSADPPYVNVRPFNLASLTTRGFDIEASYRKNLEELGLFGTLTLRGLATKTIKFTANPGISGQAIQQLAGNNNANAIAPGNVGVAKWKAFLQQSYQLGKVQLTVIERIISSGKINPAAVVCQAGSCPATTLNNPTTNFNYVPGRTYLDLGLTFDLTDQISLFAKVDNATNKLQPRFGSDSLYDNIGRKYQGGVRVNY